MRRGSNLHTLLVPPALGGTSRRGSNHRTSRKHRCHLGKGERRTPSVRFPLYAGGTVKLVFPLKLARIPLRREGGQNRFPLLIGGTLRRGSSTFTPTLTRPLHAGGRNPIFSGSPCHRGNLKEGVKSAPLRSLAQGQKATQGHNKYLPAWGRTSRYDSHADWPPDRRHSGRPIRSS